MITNCNTRESKQVFIVPIINYYERIDKIHTEVP